MDSVKLQQLKFLIYKYAPELIDRQFMVHFIVDKEYITEVMLYI